MDNRKIKTRDPGKLTVEDLRTLSSILGWTQDHEVEGLSLDGLLAFYHAANDAGYCSWVEWYGDEPEPAHKVYQRLRKTQKRRQAPNRRMSKKRR